MASPRPAAAFRRSRSPSISTPTASSTSAPRTWAPAGSRRSPSPPPPTCPRRTWKRPSRKPSSTRQRTKSAARMWRSATALTKPFTSAKNPLNELGDKLDAADKTELQQKLDALKEALKGQDTEAIKQKQEDLHEEVLRCQRQGLPGQRPGRRRADGGSAPMPAEPMALPATATTTTAK